MTQRQRLETSSTAVPPRQVFLHVTINQTTGSDIKPYPIFYFILRSSNRRVCSASFDAG